jgi:1-acyl-sn-glycerol-3-phosphate acyltransferase
MDCGRCAGPRCGECRGVKSRHRIDWPRHTPWLYRGFCRYCARYARKHFHAVRLSRESAAIPDGDTPILVVLNHPGWWDPIIGFLLSRSFGTRTHFGAMEAKALEKYSIMKRLGIFGVDRESFAGVAAFLRTGTAILSVPGNVLWITAQGRFADVRVRPLALESGVGHLAARMTTGLVLPIAIEYVFWNESRPEALVRIGEAIPINPTTQSTGQDWTARIESALASTLDALNAEAMARDSQQFTSLVEGSSGVGGIYDLWRRLRSTLRGQRFDARHEQVKP